LKTKRDELRKLEAELRVVQDQIRTLEESADVRSTPPSSGLYTVKATIASHLTMITRTITVKELAKLISDQNLRPG
ncbi:hypothetical protein EV182_005913, partial [Spiromyces aspiralis]